MAGAAALSADPWRVAPARALGVACLSGRIQRRAQGCDHWTRHAPLDDAMFRSATFEQLGETKLEGAVTTDICGKRDSHATRLDAEAQETIKNARLHRKGSTAIFFESNGGQAKTDATVPEIRFAVAEPGLDIGNVETALEALTEGCYYLAVERNRYHFSLKENLNKRFCRPARDYSARPS